MGVCSLAGCSLAGGTAFARGFCSALFHTAFCNKIRLLELQTICCFPKACRGIKSPFNPLKNPCHSPGWFRGGGFESFSSVAKGVLAFTGGQCRSQAPGRCLGRRRFEPWEGKKGKASTGRKHLPPSPLPTGFSVLLRLSAPFQGPPYFAAEEPSLSDNSERIN